MGNSFTRNQVLGIVAAALVFLFFISNYIGSSPNYQAQIVQAMQTDSQNNDLLLKQLDADDVVAIQELKVLGTRMATLRQQLDARDAQRQSIKAQKEAVSQGLGTGK